MACALFGTGCTAEYDGGDELLSEYTVARLKVSGFAENSSEPDAHIATVRGYRFEDDVLKEIIIPSEPDADGRCMFRPVEKKGEVCFLVNAGQLEELEQMRPDVTTKTEFLNLSADIDEMISDEGYVVMSGQMDLERVPASGEAVNLKRSVARVDLSSLDKGVNVLQVTIKGMYRQGYVCERSDKAAPSASAVLDFSKEYTSFNNCTEPLLYLPEQSGVKSEVEVIAVSNGAHYRLTTSLPAVIERNVIYTLRVHGRGGDLSIETTTDEWEEGTQTESDKLLKGKINVAASLLSEGVRVNATGDSVFIPYTGSDMHLAFMGEEGASVVIEGKVNGVDVHPVSVKNLQQIAMVDVQSKLRVPGTSEEYIYVEIYRNKVHTGRVVLVVEPSPVRLEGLLQLDENGICDFGRYIEGELGRLMLPEGKTARMEYADEESPWIKLVSVDNGYRLLGGWKPNDPKADGRVQEGKLVISDMDGKHEEAYIIRRRNWGLPVVNINGTWWCKYNLRGNVKRFEDQLLPKDDPAKDVDLLDYLNTCDEADLLPVLGYQYQAGYPEGYPLRHDGTAFYYEGMRVSAQSFGTLAPEEMAPEGYRIPAYEDYAFFARNTDFNVGGIGTRTYQNAAGQTITVTITERDVSFEGQPYGIMAFYDFEYEGKHWVLYGLGHQWNTTPGNIARMSILLATYGHSSHSWMMEGYAQADRPGENWLKFVAQNNTKTRVVRCVKIPVEYVIE